MLTEDEKRFVASWEIDRLRKKKLIRQLSVGLPLSSVLVLAIGINFVSGWYKRADMEIRSSGSLIVILLIASIGIVIFTTVFSAKHKWDINEQRYQELLKKRDQA
jgi:membrane protein YdbS with pleckstrin-like domain